VAIDGEIQALKDYLSGEYGYQGHKPGPYHQRPEGQYFDDEHLDAVQEYVDHVTAPQAAQAAAAIDWIGQRKEAQKASVVAFRDAVVGEQNGRGAYESEQFTLQVDGYIQSNADLAAGLLADIQAKNDAIQGTLDALKHEHYGYQDAHGYRYKLLNQLHHQRVIFEQAVEAAWVTWTQSRDLAVKTAASGAAASAEAFEGFLATKLGEAEAASGAIRSDLAGQVGAKGEALKAAVQEAARVFAEKQTYKRNYIATVPDHHKAQALAKKVDLEDQIFQQTVKNIWTSFTYEATGLEQWLDSFLDEEGAALAAAQDAIGNALADALADQLDRLGAALGELGDAFFQAKHDESERLMQALYGYGYGDYQADYTPVFKHEDEVVEHPVVHHVEPAYVPEPVYHAPHHEVYSVTTGPYESSEGYLSEDSFDSGPYASESQYRNTEYDHHEPHRPHGPHHGPHGAHHPTTVPAVHSGEVFYEGEDPYVVYDQGYAPDAHGAAVVHHEPHYEPSYDEGTHYAAAAPVYHEPHHEESYTDSVYESSGYHSSYETSRYGETSYISRGHRQVHAPHRNYEHVEPYRPEPVHVDSYAAPVAAPV
jgi:hypothetical protein